MKWRIFSTIEFEHIFHSSSTAAPPFALFSAADESNLKQPRVKKRLSPPPSISNSYLNFISTDFAELGEEKPTCLYQALKDSLRTPAHPLVRIICNSNKAEKRLCFLAAPNPLRIFKETSSTPTPTPCSCDYCGEIARVLIKRLQLLTLEEPFSSNAAAHEVLKEFSGGTVFKECANVAQCRFRNF